MIVVITISVIGVVLALVAGYTNLKGCLKIAFILLTLLACVHYNYGNDYTSYYATWSIISKESLNECIMGNRWIYPMGVRPEVGWIILNKLFSFTGGFYVLVAIISIFENVVYYNFIKDLVPRKWWWLAVFIYLFDYRYYVLNFSLLRQGLAICLCILAYMFFEKKNSKMSAILLMVAISIHTSALILIPVVFVIKIGMRNVKRYIKILTIVTIALFLSSNIATRIFDSIIGYGVLSKYSELYAGWTASASYGMGFLFIVMQYVLMLCYLYINGTKDTITNREKTIILIAYCAILIKPFEIVGAALISRLAFYFSVYDIVALPIVYNKMQKKAIKAVFVIMLITVTVYSYYKFWTNPVYINSFTEFHTIFEVL